MVYFISTEDKKFIKIGFATKINRRFNHIQCHCPYELKLELLMEGGHNKEQEIHIKFSNDEYRGEWFVFSKKISSYINMCIQNNINIEWIKGNRNTKYSCNFKEKKRLRRRNAIARNER